MGVGDVSYGDPDAKIQTPHIDKLASGGMTFTDGHSSSGICTPSRFAMLTGQHHWRRFHGIAQAYDGSVFEPGDFTIDKMFKEKGYRTAAFGKWHLCWDFDAIRKPGVKKKIGLKVLRLDSAFPVVDRAGLTATLATGRSISLPLDRERPIRNHPNQTSHQIGPLAGGGTRPGPMAESWNPYDVFNYDRRR